jgi:hypothetical protein
MKHKTFITSLTILILLFLSIGIATAQGPTEELRVGAEVVDRRTATGKHVYLGNGQYQARISSVPIHYRDAQGNWQEIDTTLRPQTKGVYAVEANGLQTYLPSHSGGVVSVAGRVYPQAESPAAALSETEITEEEAGPLRLAADRTLPPVDVSLSWQPVAWRYTDAAGHVDDLAAVQPVAGQVEGDTITYEGVMPGVNESYRVIPNGLKHQLTLLSPPRAPAGGLSGELTLDYVGTMELPVGLVLYADGAVQAGDFTTEGPIEVRDSQGHPLLVLMAPVAYEAENRREMAGGSYAVWREGGSPRLAWRTPAAWLLAPARRYPVVLDPTVNIFPSSDDAGIIENSPDSNYDINTELEIGHVLAAPDYAARALIRWRLSDIPGIPDYALIDDTASSDVQVRLYQTGRSGTGNNRVVGLYNVTSSWTESGVTWNSRNGSSNWTTPGGDYDGSFLTTAVVGTSTGYRTWQSLSLRDVVALWRTEDTLGANYGRPNYGLLFRYPQETDYELKRFGSREGAPFEYPELDVTYTDGPQVLADQTPVARRVPSPDYYSIPSSAYWQAVGIRMNNAAADYNLRLYEDENYTTQLAVSTGEEGEVDFVVIDQGAPNASRYPMTYSYNGETGSYRIEYSERIAYFDTGIDPGDSHGPYPMDTTDVIRLWTLDETVGDETCILVNPTSSDEESPRLGVAVFATDWPPGDYYFSRSDALASAVASRGGVSVSIAYTAPSDGAYGLVVWNEGSSSSTDFYIEGCTSSGGVFLPIVVKNN